MSSPLPAPRVAIVTGGSSGIGFACAQQLVDAGYEVTITARGRDRLERAANEIGARWIVADCSEEEDIAQLRAGHDHVDLVVSAAGIQEGSVVREQGIEVFDRVLHANLRSAYLVAAGLLPLMGPGSRFVFISSTTGGQRGMPGLSVYSASKGGLNAFAQAFAAEVEGDGVHVHTIIPAPVETPMLGGVRTFSLAPSDVADVVMFLERLHPAVVIREIVMRAAMKGPFADRGAVAVDLAT